MSLTLEDLFTSPAGFGVPASPLQRAVCRVIDGTPLAELGERADVRAALGCDPANLPSGPPGEVLLLAGVRCGKSMLTAANAIVASQRVDVSGLSAGEVPRVSVVSLDLDRAGAVLEHLHGQVTSRPVLRRLLVGDVTARGCTLRSPSGRPVEIRVEAAAKAGGTLVARWSAGVVFDEAPRLGGAEYVANLPHMRSAILGRLLPGAQILMVGSPWAPEGLPYELATEHFGRPTRDLVVVRARADALNPSWWTPARVEHFRRTHPRVFATDVLGEFGLSEDAAFELDHLERAFLPWHFDGWSQGRPVIIIDASSLRGDAFVAVVARMLRRGDDHVLRAESWHAWQSAQLGEVTMGHIVDSLAIIARDLGVREVVGDQREDASLYSMFAAKGIRFTPIPWTNANKQAAVTTLRRLMAEGALSLAANPTAREQLANYRERKLPGGGFTYAGRGKHDDHAAAVLTLALALDANLIPGGLRHEDAPSTSCGPRPAAEFHGPRAESFNVVADAHGVRIARHRPGRTRSFTGGGY